MKTTNFGPHTWRILDERDGKALLLCEDIIERCAYNDAFTPTAWETCSLRKYLNGEFLEKFSPEERARIALTRNDNPANTWRRTQGKAFNTPGGNPTEDYVFLLSVEEALKYYHGLKLCKDGDGDEWWYEADERIIAKCDGRPAWWWLRSPGIFQNYAAAVYDDGYVFLLGGTVPNETGGVRPALWLNLELEESPNPCGACLNFIGNSAWRGGRPAVDEAARKMFQALERGRLCSVVVWHKTAAELPPGSGEYLSFIQKSGRIEYDRMVVATFDVDFEMDGWSCYNHWLLPPDYWAELPAPPKKEETS